MKNNRIIIIDYDIGNVLSVKRAMATMGYEAEVSRDHQLIHQADILILPGVGAFEKAMTQLMYYDLIPLIKKHVASGKLLVGICLGMQLLFESSHEFGVHQGLGLLAGSVTKLKESTDEGQSIKVPHIGWNRLDWSIDRPDTLDDWYYFVHSYGVSGLLPCVIATTQYGDNRIGAVVRHDNVIGFQFHPEKSGVAGMHLLAHFLTENMG